MGFNISSSRSKEANFFKKLNKQKIADNIHRQGMIANSVWLIQRALPVIILSSLPHLTKCNTLDYEADVPLRMLEPRVQRAPFNSWAGKRFHSGGYDMSQPDFGRMNGIEQFYLNHLAGSRSESPFSQGKRAPFNSWAGKRAPFNSWAGKRSSEELKDQDLLFNHGDARFGDSESSHRVKRSSGEFAENAESDNHHDSLVRIARDASNSRQLRRRVRSNTAFSAWGGK